MSADDTASFIIVTTLNYNGSSILGDVSDNNSNGWLDVYDLYTSDLTGQEGIASEATRNFQIAIQLSEDVTGQYQSDGIDITMSFILKQ
jgi:hypothetical protein